MSSEIKSPEEGIYDGNEQDNYMIYGMCFGMLAGSVAMSICFSLGHVTFGAVCLSLGMGIGLVIGMCIKKKK